MRSAAALLLLVTPSALLGQMHRVSHPEQAVRAVGVYEWTGDIVKPSAARLVPVSLFYTGHYEDAGIYLARPVPFALESDVEYILQTAGIKQGFLDLSYARNLRNSVAAAATGTTPYEDGWFGYGKYRPLPKPKPLRDNARQGNAHTVQEANNKDGRPHFNNKPSSNDNASDDSDKPEKVHIDDDSKDRKSSDPDPERPTLGHAPPDTSSNNKGKKQKDPAASVSQTPPDPASDPDRPSLKKHKPTDAASIDSEAVTGGDKMLDDPNRPNLHRGRPDGSTAGEELTQMKGLPADLHQMAAVSDAKERPEHDFTHHFDSDTERTMALSRMRAIAEFEINNPGKLLPTALTVAPAAGQAAAAPAMTSATAPAADAPATEAAPPALRRGRPLPTVNGHKVTAKPPRSNMVRQPLLADEHFFAYELSFGAGATYIYTAHTAMSADDVHYVTVVAQPDVFGTLQVALRTSTDAAHLDRTPWMRPVDVVDADASNRASLLMELRSQRSRQFALYRVMAGKADQTYLSGTTQ